MICIVPSALEARAISHALSGHEEWRSPLRVQVPHLEVVSREISRVGFFTLFRLAERCAAARIEVDDVAYPPRVSFTHPDLKHGGGFILWTKNGIIDYLECYINGDEVLPDPISGGEEFTFV